MVESWGVPQRGGCSKASNACTDLLPLVKTTRPQKTMSGTQRWNHAAIQSLQAILEHAQFESGKIGWWTSAGWERSPVNKTAVMERVETGTRQACLQHASVLWRMWQHMAAKKNGL
jgi:hypothetical protein